jgi:hypothetical protein
MWPSDPGVTPRTAKRGQTRQDPPLVRGRTDEVSTNDAQGMPRVLQSEEDPVANPVPAGSDVSSGTYRCTNCDNEIQMESRGHVPPCPSCGNGEWDTVRGGDSVNDPYPDRLA